MILRECAKRYRGLFMRQAKAISVWKNRGRATAAKPKALLQAEQQALLLDLRPLLTTSARLD